MSESIASKILSHLKSPSYNPTKARRVARELNLDTDETYPTFREVVRGLMDQGHVIIGDEGHLTLPTATFRSPPHPPTDAPAKSTGKSGGKRGTTPAETRPPERSNEIIGTYSANRRGFGFVAPLDPTAKEDLFIPPGQEMGALHGDKVRARIGGNTERGIAGKVVEILERSNAKFVGELKKVGGKWFVLPDGNALTQPISIPDAASKSVPPGSKVVVEITEYPDPRGGDNAQAVGVITEILGQAGEKDVDLRAIMIQYGLPEEFPEEVKADARKATERFKPEEEKARRLDLTNTLIVTIDPDTAKDYDDAISLKDLGDGTWELGVHIADVSHFVTEGSPLDEEAKKRGNSTYFPGHVIPMLPEILSNGVCSLMEGVPRLCKSAFIVLDEDAKPIRTWFAETVIQSAKRLRYVEAQDLIDGNDEIYHPDGNRKPSDYSPEVRQLLQDMNSLAKRIQKRRHAAGQLVLDLPVIELKLDEAGKVIGTAKEDTSFTHTLIEMFMVEANEAVARLFDAIDVPFIRRIHPEPDPEAGERLNKFVTVAGHKIPKELDRHAMQRLVMSVRDKPESYAINLAVLKSLARAEYSPQVDGHFALASQHYTHFTSPIRRYADLMIHRLLKKFLDKTGGGPARRPKGKIHLDNIPSFDDLVQQGRHMSFTERRSEDAERELKKVKVLELLAGRIGQDFAGVITGVANFGIFVQLNEYLLEGVIRFEDLMDDWWDVDTHTGVVKGQRTGTRMGIGDAVMARIVRVDPPRRELTLSITAITGQVSRTHLPKGPVEKDGKRGKHRNEGDPQERGTERPHKRKKQASGAFGRQAQEARGGADRRRSGGRGQPGRSPSTGNNAGGTPKKNGKWKNKFSTGADKRAQRSKNRNRGKGSQGGGGKGRR